MGKETRNPALLPNQYLLTELDYATCRKWFESDFLPTASISELRTALKFRDQWSQYLDIDPGELSTLLTDTITDRKLTHKLQQTVHGLCERRHSPLYDYGETKTTLGHGCYKSKKHPQCG